MPSSGVCGVCRRVCECGSVFFGECGLYVLHSLWALCLMELITCLSCSRTLPSSTSQLRIHLRAYIHTGAHVHKCTPSAHLILPPKKPAHLFTICFTVTGLERTAEIWEVSCTCVFRRINTSSCLPQAVCCRGPWRLILLTFSGVLRPPHKQVRGQRAWFGKNKLSCLISCLLGSLMMFRFQGYLSIDQKRPLTLSGC